MTPFYKTPYVSINAQISQVGTTPSAPNTLMIISRRGTVNDNTLGILNNFPLYTPIEIPSDVTSSGALLLGYLESIGATINTGLSATINLVAPNTVTTQTIGSQSFVTLTWTAEPIGWTNIQNINITGTASQSSGSVIGTITKVVTNTGAYQLILSNVTGTFTNSNVVSIVYVNQSITLPDGKQTEQFALDLYYAVAGQAGLVNSLNLTFAKPQIWCTIVSDRDDEFNAVNTATPLSTVTTVINNGDGTVTLVWNTAPANWIYVPDTAFGDTVITDSTATASGVFMKKLPAQYTPTGSGFAMQVKVTSGTFANGDTISMALDPTVSILDRVQELPVWFRFIQCNTGATAATDLTSGAGDLNPFYNFINGLNAPLAASSQKFGTVGIVAVTTMPASDYLAFGEVNDFNFSLPDFYYPNELTDVYISAGQLAASYAAVNASNTVPYPDLNGVVLPSFPVSNDSSTYIQVGVNADSENLLDIGLAPIAVNSQSQAYMVLNINSQTTIPNTLLTDQEFYDLHAVQVVQELKFRAWSVSQNPQFQNALITPSLIQEMSNAIYGMLVTAQNDGMIFNVDSLKNLIVVTLDPVNPHALDIRFSVQITPALTSFVFNISIISALANTQTTQA